MVTTPRGGGTRFHDRGERDAPAGRARRPRRAARRGTRTLRAWGRPCRAHGDVPGTRAAGDVGPYHKRPRDRHAPVPPRRGNGMRRLVGRDVLGAPRAGGRARCARGDVPGTRAAEDVGPYHKCPRGRHAPVPPRRGNGMRRLVGRDVLGAPRAGDVHAARTGTFRGRGPPGTSAPTTNAPWPPCARAAPAGERDASAGRARRPRRAARRGTRTLRARGRSGDAGRRGRRPLPQMSPWPPCARAAPAGERDAPAGRARRPRRAARRGRPCRAHGDVPGTRAAGDVGPYHKRPVAAMRPCRPGGGTGCVGW